MHQATTVPSPALYIGGSWVEPEHSFDVIDPATGEVVGQAANANPQHARAALDAAVVAQPEWAAVPPRMRGDLLHHVRDLLEDRIDAFVDVMVRESGKPRHEAAGEMALTLDFVRWFAEQSAHVHGTYSRASRGDFRILTTRHPVGPTLVIAPWNFPALLPIRKVVAALAAGCTVTLKPAPETPFTAMLIADVLDAVGIPAGVFNLLPTDQAPSVCGAIIEDPRLRKISFTGSSAVGATILAAAAPNITSTQLELGGNGPFVVLDDADVPCAVEQAISTKFRNSGQACVAANRIIVQRGVAEEFTSALVHATSNLVVGSGMQDDTDVGPMITDAARRRIEQRVEALADEGEILLGGQPVDRPGFFYAPTVIRMAGPTAAFTSDELFAPIAPVHVVESVDEAVDVANATDLGLSAYVFTRDLSRAVSVAERLDTGMVGVNRGLMADPAAPFGGVKRSGLGREGGHDALDEFLETKYIALTI